MLVDTVGIPGRCNREKFRMEGVTEKSLGCICDLIS